jgi:hypothetical protein
MITIFKPMVLGTFCEAIIYLTTLILFVTFCEVASLLATGISVGQDLGIDLIRLLSVPTSGSFPSPLIG